jgi:hypothetical protein
MEYSVPTAAPDFVVPVLAAGLTIAASYLNGRNFRPVESMGPEFKAEEAKGIATRTDAPAVFLNPVSTGLPGSILGPDDIANRG